MINNIFPWQESAWRAFADLLNEGRLPHALLLTGPAGIGKKAFASAMAKSVLCERRQTQAQACGVCASCRWFDAGSHPDLRRVRPALWAAYEGAENDTEEGGEAPESEGASDKKLSKDISIAHIRALADFAALSASRNGLRVALVYPAEAMNVSAANALLKTLEEPSGSFLFLLVSDAPHRLLPTIRSRCRSWPLTAPTREIALAWLEQQRMTQAEQKWAALGGAPLAVCEYEATTFWKTQDLLLTALSDPVRLDAPTLAKQLESAIKQNDKERQSGAARAVDLPLVVGWLQRWTADVLYCHFGAPIRYYPHRADAVQRSAAHAPQAWLVYAQWLTRAQREASHPVNTVLFLEDCLLRCPAAWPAAKGR